MQCTNCHEIVPDTAKVCGYCGHRLVAPQPQPIASHPTGFRSQPEPATVQDSINAPEPTLKSRKERTSRGWLWGIIIIVFLVAAGGAFTLFVLPRLNRTAITNIFTMPSARRQQPTQQSAPESVPNIPTVQVPELLPTVSNSVGTPESVPYMPPSLTLNLINPRELHRESFDEGIGAGWAFGGNSNFVKLNGSDSGLQLFTNEPDNITQVSSAAFVRGQGIYISFKLSSPPTDVEFYLAQGDFGMDAYKRFGGAIRPDAQDKMVGTIFSGKDFVPASGTGRMSFTPERWYGLFIGMDVNGECRLAAWDWEDPSVVGWLTYTAPSGWSSGQWNFITQVGKGVVNLNDFVLISFDGFK